MRTITGLLKDNDRVYVYLNGENVKKRFLRDAEAEGFSYADGNNPTEVDCDSVVAIHPDMKIYHLGWVSHLAYKQAKRIGDKKVVRVDYFKYISGSKNYKINRKDA